MLRERLSIYFRLFRITFYLSSVTFGGGFAIIPFMKRIFVDDLKWIDEEEMLNLVAIAQSTPGAVAVNASILMGYRIKGVKGAVVTIAGTILPPMLIISVISFFYTEFRDNEVVNAVLKGMQAGVAAVIIDVVINLGGKVVKSKDYMFIFVMIGAFAATFILKINVIFIILACGMIGAAKFIIKSKMDKKISGEQL